MPIGRVAADFRQPRAGQDSDEQGHDHGRAAHFDRTDDDVAQATHGPCRGRVHGKDVQVQAAEPLLEQRIEDQEQGADGDDRRQAAENGTDREDRNRPEEIPAPACPW